MSIYKEGSEATVSGAAAKLDLRTLNEQTETAASFGLAKFGSGTGWSWTVTNFGNNHYEILGVHTQDGMRPVSKRKKTSKPRATVRSQMTDEDVSRTMRRTKKKVRELAMMVQPDKLITLTTRAPIVDADQFKKICSRFFAKCRKHKRSFNYVAVPERHMSEKTSDAKFGSLHLHIATRSSIRYNELRDMWRDAVQLELQDGDWSGAGLNASAGGKDGRHHDRRSIARYLSKYLTKDIDNEHFTPNKRRYWASRGIAKPEKTRYFSVPSVHTETFRTIFSEVCGVDIKKMFIPDRLIGQPPIIWLSTG